MYLYIPKIYKKSQSYFSQINITNGVNSDTNNQTINPWFITELTDGDGSFYISIIKNSQNLVGWQVQIYFTIATGINPPNFKMLQLINNYFDNIGRISLSFTNGVGREEIC